MKQIAKSKAYNDCPHVRWASYLGLTYRTTSVFPANHVTAVLIFKTPKKKVWSKKVVHFEAFFKKDVPRAVLGQTIKRWRKEAKKRAEKLEKKGYEAYFVVASAYHWTSDIEGAIRYRKILPEEVPGLLAKLGLSKPQSGVSYGCDNRSAYC